MTFFTIIFCQKLFVVKDENKQKGAGDGPLKRNKKQITTYEFINYFISLFKITLLKSPFWFNSSDIGGIQTGISSVIGIHIDIKPTSPNRPLVFYLHNTKNKTLKW